MYVCNFNQFGTFPLLGGLFVAAFEAKAEAEPELFEFEPETL